MSHSAPKFQNIQALRGIAVMLVVIFHLFGVEQIYGKGVMILPQLCNIGAGGVDIFFVISGFVMITITSGQFQKRNTVTHFLTHRITRIYPLYWFYSLIIVMLVVVHPSWIKNAFELKYDYVRSFLLLPMEIHRLLLVVGWTLLHEMYFYMVIALFLFFPEKHLAKLLLLWFVIITPSYYYIDSGNQTLLLITDPLTTEFIAGCFITRLLVFKQKLPLWFILITGIILLFVGINYYYFMPLNKVPDDWQRLALFGIPSFVLVYYGVALERFGILFPRLLAKLGDISYSIYLSHSLVLLVLAKIFSLLPLHYIFINILEYMFMVITVIITGIVSYQLLEKPMMKFFRNKIKFSYSLLDYFKIQRANE